MRYKEKAVSISSALFTMGPRHAVLLIAFACNVMPAQANTADELRQLHSQHQSALANNPYHKPIHIESSDQSGALQGNIYAVIDQSHLTLRQALDDLNHWCDVLILHQNVKACTTSNQQNQGALRLYAGRKFAQPLKDSFPIEFKTDNITSTGEYLEVSLSADEGPLNTHSYRIKFSAIPLGSQTSFLHLSYAYQYGFAAKTAMKGYLATLGRNKIGFSVIDEKDNQPVYIKGIRGVIERNTMRYYLAIVAYLHSLSAPAEKQQATRLENWFDATQQYPKQLHELDRDDYIKMKRDELDRQEQLQSEISGLVLPGLHATTWQILAILGIANKGDHLFGQAAIHVPGGIGVLGRDNAA